MPTTRIEGWTDSIVKFSPDAPNGLEWVKVFMNEIPVECDRCILFISSDGSTPEVMTKEEAEEMLGAMMACLSFVPQPELVKALRESFSIVTKRYNITLP